MENSSRTLRRNASHPRHKKSHKGLKIFFTILLVIILIVGGIIGKFYLDTKSAINKAQMQNPPKTTAVDFSSGSPFTTLLIGTNQLNDKKFVSEVVVASVNTRTRKTTVVNFPTDALFSDNSNLNLIYTNGGNEGVLNKVQQLLGKPINKIIVANLDGLSNLVEATDGISLENPKGFVSNGYHFDQGTIQLQNSSEASAYLNLLNDKDIKNYTTRQQAVTISVAYNLKKPTKILLNYGKLLDVFSSNVQTNLSFSELKTIALKYYKALHLNKLNIHTIKSPVDGETKMVTSKEMENVKRQFEKTLQ